MPLDRAACDCDGRYRMLVEQCPDPIVVHADGALIYANPAALALGGYNTLFDVVGRSIAEFIHPEEPINSKELTIIRSDGELVFVEQASMPTRFEGLEAVQVVLRDITERKRAEEALAYQASHDALTGLANRTLLLNHLDTGITRGVAMGLLLMDLDRFKEVNHTLGHHAGDALLQQVGARLRGVLREADSIARLGGDEFAAVMPGLDRTAAARCANDLLHLFETPFQVEGQPVVVGASIGIALAPEHGDQADMLLRRADVAMYVAKRAGDGFAFYEPHQDKHTPDRLVMIGDLRRSTRASWCCTSNPRSICALAIWRVWKRWCAGSTHCAAWSRQISSFPLPSRPG
jgi:diguanylate cyclase (GGDEF)-like protein